MKILFDVDGVIYDIEKFMHKYAVLFFSKKNIQIVNENGYGVMEIFNCSKEQEEEFWTKYAIKYLLLYKPKNDVVETIKKLKQEGHEISLFTCKRCPNSIIKKYLVDILFRGGLAIHRVSVDKIFVFSTDEGESVNTYDKKKIALLQNNDYDIVIEDKVGNLIEFSKIKHVNILQMETKNNSFFESKDIEKVRNGNDLYTIIKKIETKKYNSSTVFSEFKRLNKSEKRELSNLELLKYYETLKNYSSSLPFNVNRIKKGESFFRIVSILYGRLIRFKYKPIIFGSENIPKDSNLIIVSNHKCERDFKLILGSLKGVIWHPLIKDELMEQNIGKLFEKIGSISVNRTCPYSRKNATIEMLKYLLNDFSVLCFPEGTYTKKITNELLAPFAGESATYLAQVSGKEILPIAITDNYDDANGPIVRIGSPIRISKEEDIDLANANLWSVMYNLVKENHVFENRNS